MRMLLLSVLLFVFNAEAQSTLDELKCDLYRFYVDDQMEYWPGIIDEMEALNDSSVRAQKEILMARYGLIGYYLGNERKREARNALAIAFEQLAKVQTRFPGEAAFYCLDACFHSYQITLSMFEAPILYPRHQAALRHARKLSDSDPLLYFEEANMSFYKPRFLGGDKKAAVWLYQKSLQLLEKQSCRECCWFELMLELFLLKAYHETGDDSRFAVLWADIQQKHGELTWVNRFLESRVVD